MISTSPKNLCSLTNMPFEPFREGIEICHLLIGEPAVALLKYPAGARVPHHRHNGLETIFVLSGAQSDENGTYEAGSFVVNPQRTEHSVRPEAGCVLLIKWEKPIEFIDTEARS